MSRLRTGEFEPFPGAAPSCWVPGPGVIRAGDGGLEWESATEGVVRVWALGGLGCIRKVPS